MLTFYVLKLLVRIRFPKMNTAGEKIFFLFSQNMLPVNCNLIDSVRLTEDRNRSEGINLAVFLFLMMTTTRKPLGAQLIIYWSFNCVWMPGRPYVGFLGSTRECCAGNTQNKSLRLLSCGMWRGYLLGCNAAYSGRNTPTFQRNVPPPSSESNSQAEGKHSLCTVLSSRM
jgi:hypothetical protein